MDIDGFDIDGVGDDGWDGPGHNSWHGDSGSHHDGHVSKGFFESIGEWVSAISDFFIEETTELTNEDKKRLSQQSKNKNVLIGAGIVLLTAGVGAYFYVRHKQKQAQKQRAEHAARHLAQHKPAEEHQHASPMQEPHAREQKAEPSTPPLQEPAHAASSFAAREKTHTSHVEMAQDRAAKPATNGLGS